MNIHYPFISLWKEGEKGGKKGLVGKEGHFFFSALRGKRFIRRNQDFQFGAGPEVVLARCFACIIHGEKGV